MYYDLNIAWPVRIPAASAQAGSSGSAGNKKQKGKQASTTTAQAGGNDAAVKTGADLLTAGERADVEKAVKMAIKRELVSICVLYSLGVTNAEHTFDRHW